MARRKLSHEGTLVLDSEGLSKILADDEQVVALVAEARLCGMEVVISSLTIIEAVHARTNKSRLNWVLSGLRVVPVGDEEARAASKLLMEAGLHGPEYAIDAAVAETALRQNRPVVMLASDISAAIGSGSWRCDSSSRGCSRDAWPVLCWADGETSGTPPFRPYQAVLVDDNDELGAIAGAELGHGTPAPTRPPTRIRRPHAPYSPPKTPFFGTTAPSPATPA